MRSIVRIVLAIAAIAALAYVLMFKDKIRVQIVAPDDYVHGAVIQINGVHESAGQPLIVEHFNRLLTSETEFNVTVPLRPPWIFNDLRVEFRHPKYRPITETVPGNPVWRRKDITLTPERWTTNDKHNWIQPNEQTTIDALQHLRWIRSDYLDRDEWLVVNEALQAERRLALGSLPYAGGKKSGDWEQVRQLTIAEMHEIVALLEERVLRPCPDGYEVQSQVYPPCGRQKSNVIWPEDVGRDTRFDRFWDDAELIVHARKDLAERLEIDPGTIRLAGIQKTALPPAADICSEQALAAADENTLAVLIFLQTRDGLYRYQALEAGAPSFCAQQ